MSTATKKKTTKKAASKKAASKKTTANKTTASKKAATKKTSTKAESVGKGTKKDPRLMSVAPDRIVVSPKLQPRSNLGDTSDLKKSIKVSGVLSSLVVRPKGDKYELLCGARRLACAQELGLKSVPIQVRTDLDDDNEALAAAVGENSGDARTALAPMDQARSFKRLADEGWSPPKIASRCGCASNTVRNALALADAPKDVQKKLESGEIKQMTAIALTKADPAIRSAIIDGVSEGTTEREVRSMISDQTKALKERGDAPEPKKTKSGAVDKRAKNNKGGLEKVWRPKKSINIEIDRIVVAIIDLEGKKKLKGADAERLIALKGYLAALFFACGLVEDESISSKDYKAAFNAIKSLVEEAATEEEAEAEAEEVEEEDEEEPDDEDFDIDDEDDDEEEEEEEDEDEIDID